MAMEVTTKRPLHEHAVPIVMMAMSLLIVSAGCYGYYANASTNIEATVGKAFIGQVLRVQPGGHGGGLIEVTASSDEASNDVGSISDTGRTADLLYSFNQKNLDKNVNH